MSEAVTCYSEFLLFESVFFITLCIHLTNNSRYRSPHFTPFCTISSLYILTAARYAPKSELGQIHNPLFFLAKDKR